MKRKYIIFILFFILLLPINVLATNVELEQNGTKTTYETLNEALNNALDNTEVKITLLNDLSINSTININANKNIIIDGNNYNLTYLNNNGIWYTGQLFNIKANGTLTLNNLTIDGNNNYLFDNETYQSDLKNNYKAENVSKYLTSELNKPNITANMINNAGNLTLDNVTIKNFFSMSGKNLINGSANTITKIINTKIEHCATTSGGLVIYVSGANAKVYVEDGTIINDNYVASNGGIFKIYSGAVLEMNGGEVKNTKAANTNGVVSMTYGTGSSFILNDGIISNNSGVAGANNGRNAPFYVHSGSKFIMNGGIIEYNYGSSNGGLDAPGYSNADVELNGGTIQYNETTKPGYEQRSDVNIQYDYDLTLGKDMNINGNIYVVGDLTNNGNINGNVILDLSTSTTSNTITGEGKITGDVIIKYSGETEPVINENINITGRQVSYETTTEAVARFEFNGGKDKEGYSYDLIAVTKEDGTLDRIPTPTKEGHTFINWYTDKDLTMIWNNSKVTTDITLYASWQINEYIITWDVDGKKTTAVYKYGDIIKLPEEPIKEGYAFTGWKNYEENMTTPASNMTFIATFEKIKNPNTGITTPHLVLTVLLLLSIGFIKLTDKKKYI